MESNYYGIESLRGKVKEKNDMLEDENSVSEKPRDGCP